MSQQFWDGSWRMLQNHVWGEDPVKVQGRPSDFIMTEYEKSALLKRRLRIYYSLRFLAKFWRRIKEYHNFLERLLKYFLLFWAYICVRLDFLQILQAKQQVVEADMNFQASFVSQTWGRFAKILNDITLTQYFFSTNVVIFIKGILFPFNM